MDKVQLSINWVLPAFDHHAADYSPFHGHLAPGVASTAEFEAAVAVHTHGGGQPHEHGPAARPLTPSALAGTETTPTVIGLSLLDGWRALLATATDLVVATHWPLPQPPLAVWLTLAAAAVILHKRLLPLPEQPPRRL